MAEETLKLTFDAPETLYDYVRETANLLNTNRSRVIRCALQLGCAQLQSMPGLLKLIDTDLLRE